MIANEISNVTFLSCRLVRHLSLRFLTFILRSFILRCATENGRRKDSRQACLPDRQAGMTILKSYVNLINAFVLV